MNKSAKHLIDGTSTLDSDSISLDKNRSKAASLSKISRTKHSTYLSNPGVAFKFMNNSFSSRPVRMFESNCEIVFEEESEGNEERRRKIKKLMPVLDMREELLFHNNNAKLFGEGVERPRSTDIKLPKVIETKEEYSSIYDNPKHKLVKYLAMIDKTDKFNVVEPRSTIDSKEDQLFSSQNAIEEANQFEEDLGGNECLDDRSYSARSGSISRISNNSFIKKRVVDECVIFDRDKAMSEIVSLTERGH